MNTNAVASDPQCPQDPQGHAAFLDKAQEEQTAKCTVYHIMHSMMQLAYTLTRNDHVMDEIINYCGDKSAIKGYCKKKDDAKDKLINYQREYCNLFYSIKIKDQLCPTASCPQKKSFTTQSVTTGDMRTFTQQYACILFALLQRLYEFHSFLSESGHCDWILLDTALEEKTHPIISKLHTLMQDVIIPIQQGTSITKTLLMPHAELFTTIIERTLTVQQHCQNFSARYLLTQQASWQTTALMEDLQQYCDTCSQCNDEYIQNLQLYIPSLQRNEFLSHIMPEPMDSDSNDVTSILNYKNYLQETLQIYNCDTIKICIVHHIDLALINTEAQQKIIQNIDRFKIWGITTSKIINFLQSWTQYISSLPKCDQPPHSHALHLPQKCAEEEEELNQRHRPYDVYNPRSDAEYDSAEDEDMAEDEID